MSDQQPDLQEKQEALCKFEQKSGSSNGPFDLILEVWSHCRGNDDELSFLHGPFSDVTHQDLVGKTSACSP